MGDSETLFSRVVRGWDCAFDLPKLRVDPWEDLVLNCTISYIEPLIDNRERLAQLLLMNT